MAYLPALPLGYEVSVWLLVNNRIRVYALAMPLLELNEERMKWEEVDKFRNT